MNFWRDFIHNKSVVVVGGSNNIVGTGLGNKIDSYDTVVRVNFHWPCPFRYDPTFMTDCTEDIGCRTDILTMALTTIQLNTLRMMKPKIIVSGWGKTATTLWERFRRKINNPDALEFMLTKFHAQEKIRQSREHPECAGVLDPNRPLTSRLRCWHAFAEYIEETETPWQGFWPPSPDWCSSTGGRTLFEIWKFEPKELFIAGFDFCTKDWGWNASVHDYMKEAEMVIDMCSSDWVELSEATKRSLSSVRIF